ncbi:hypothetical protein UlMin_025926 [Ulmus minor]
MNTLWAHKDLKIFYILLIFCIVKPVLDLTNPPGDYFVCSATPLYQKLPKDVGIWQGRAHGIEHLVIPTTDYLFAPSFVDISRAIEFIHKNACCGRTTYVHCKAGRGRSTTIVLCYLVEYKNMTPAAALDCVWSRRPRVLLAPSQWMKIYKQLSRLQSEKIMLRH